MQCGKQGNGNPSDNRRAGIFYAMGPPGHGVAGDSNIAAKVVTGCKQESGLVHVTTINP